MTVYHEILDELRAIRALLAFRLPPVAEHEVCPHMIWNGLDKQCPICGQPMVASVAVEHRGKVT